MSGAQQATFMNQRSFSNAPTVIGQAYEGGFWAGDISTTANGVATHHLVVAPLSSGQFGPAQWKINNLTTPGTGSGINGDGNTASMMVLGGGASAHPCGNFCNNAVIGGFSNWYMPASNELEVCYFNLKPTTTTNSTSWGINPNAVPARASNYTSGNPAQTSAAAFQTGGAEAFNADVYWSSTQPAGYSNGHRQYFNNGVAGYALKINSFRVRCIRRVPV